MPYNEITASGNIASGFKPNKFSVIEKGGCGHFLG